MPATAKDSPQPTIREQVAAEPSRFVYAYLSAPRKGYHPELSDRWHEVAFERFDFTEHAIVAIERSVMTDQDIADWQDYAKPGEEWIWPSDTPFHLKPVVIEDNGKVTAAAIAGAADRMASAISDYDLCIRDAEFRGLVGMGKCFDEMVKAADDYHELVDPGQDCRDIPG